VSNPAVSGLQGELHRERRLEEIRREAERKPLQVAGARPAGAPFPQATPEAGYYGLPLIKPSPWSWEIPVYFFVGGAAGSAGVISAIAHFTGADPKLVRHAQWIATAGSLISPVLLTADLGRPERFLAMLRVFKPQSPMSVGVWTLLGFSSGAAAAALAGFLNERYGPARPLRMIENAGQFAALAFGLPFSNYTGVLIGATAIPVWNQNAGDLPVHFGASGLSAAVGLLELMGHRRSRALQILGISAAALELWQGVRIETRSDPKLAPLKAGPSGLITRTGGLLSGPLPLALRLASLAGNKKKSASLRRWAALAAVAGSLITRFAWIHAGQVSAQKTHTGNRRS
jgi:formate-dependent nitrite reductase membrane component NrfD